MSILGLLGLLSLLSLLGLLSLLSLLGLLGLLSLLSLISQMHFPKIYVGNPRKLYNIAVTTHPNSEKGKFAGGNGVDFFQESFGSFKSFGSFNSFSWEWLHFEPQNYDFWAAKWRLLKYTLYFPQKWHRFQKNNKVWAAKWRRWTKKWCV